MISFRASHYPPSPPHNFQKIAATSATSPLSVLVSLGMLSLLPQLALFLLPLLPEVMMNSLPPPNYAILADA